MLTHCRVTGLRLTGPLFRICKVHQSVSRISSRKDLELSSTVTVLIPHCSQSQTPRLINGVHAMGKPIRSGPKPIEALRKPGHECVPSSNQCVYHEAQTPHSACRTQENTQSVHNLIPVPSALLTLISRNQACLILSPPPPRLPSTTYPKLTLSLFHRSRFCFTRPAIPRSVCVTHLLSPQRLDWTKGYATLLASLLSSVLLKTTFFSAL